MWKGRCGMQSVEKLLAMKKKIEQDEKEFQKLKGKMEVHMADLKNKYGCDTVVAAKTLLEKIEMEVEDLEIEFEEKLKELENDYNWS